MKYFFVGTYTEPILFGTGQVFHGKGAGLYLCSFSQGEIAVIETLPLRNPSFLCVDTEWRRIYAVNELKEYLGEFGGGVTEVFYSDAGKMTERQTFATGGTDPCHIIVSPRRDFLAISNFASGSLTVFPLDGEGAIVPERQIFQHEGTSVHPVRQKGPHAHSAIFADDDTLFVPDLGIDQLVGYSCKEGILPAPEITVPVTPGSGPRFGEFSADGKHFYLINEIGSSITHFEWNNRAMTQCGTVSTLPGDFSGNNICSDLHITPDGRYLYASNRGHDSLAVFGIEPNGSLRFIDRVSCGGKTPRNFAIDPAGEYVLVGNQDSDTIVTFLIRADGRLDFVSETPFPTPVCIRFFDACFQDGSRSNRLNEGQRVE